jgi:hypothetical protein
MKAVKKETAGRQQLWRRTVVGSILRTLKINMGLGDTFYLYLRTFLLHSSIFFACLSLSRSVLDGFSYGWGKHIWVLRAGLVCKRGLGSLLVEEERKRLL